MKNCVELNFEVMTDTKYCYETMPELVDAIIQSVERQFVVYHEDNIDQPIVENSRTKYVVSGKRSFEAAKNYKGKKVAVLNYANAYSIGGNPFYAGAQEESLCRCSTLLPCLQCSEQNFYQKHIDMYRSGKMDYLGNDDLIYTPDVVVFKTDERTDPVYPQMLEHDEWYKVNVITSAAPEMYKVFGRPENYQEIIHSRVKKILDVAYREGNEVIILGAWGCGVFKNSLEIVAHEFVSQLKNYNFETVEFALATNKDVNGSAFARELQID